MIRRIILENFMSHVHTVIEPAMGLTVLIGPNNCGKSAVSHALEMICYNSEAASYAVRHGTKTAKVTIETLDPDGTTHTLTWWRTKASAGYVIDGRAISGIGRSTVPDDLHQYLKMPESESQTGKPFHLHFGLQKEPIFLLDDPPSRAAQFFSNASDANRLIEMQRRHKQKEAHAKRDRDRLDGEIVKLDLQLGELSLLTKLAEELGQVEAEHGAVIAAENRAVVLKTAAEALERTTHLVHRQREKSAALSALQSPPELQPLQAMAKQIELMDATAKQATQSRARLESLRDLTAVPQVVETDRLNRLIKQMEATRGRFAQEAERQRATGMLADVPTQGDAELLSDRIRKIGLLRDEMHRLQSKLSALQKLVAEPKLETEFPLRQHIDATLNLTEKVAKLSARDRLLQLLSEVPEEIDLKPLAVLTGSMDKSRAVVTAAQKQMTQSEQKLSELRKQIETFVKLNDHCQTCGQAITAETIIGEQVVSSGHVHQGSV